jgi:hypothetical protein
LYPLEVHCQFKEMEVVEGESENNLNIDADWRFPEKAWGRENEEMCVREEGWLPLHPFGNRKVSHRVQIVIGVIFRRSRRAWQSSCEQ